MPSLLVPEGEAQPRWPQLQAGVAELHRAVGPHRSVILLRGLVDERRAHDPARIARLGVGRDRDVKPCALYSHAAHALKQIPVLLTIDGLQSCMFTIHGFQICLQFMDFRCVCN